MARQERDASRDASREAKLAEKDRFANPSKEEKTAERRAKRAANAATKAAVVAASSHYATSPADAINDDDNDVLGADEVGPEDFPVLFISPWSSLKFGIQSLSPVALINRPWASEPT